MIKIPLTIASVKQQIEQFGTQHVVVRLNLGRNKYTTFEATINGVYPSLFTVQPQQEDFLGKTAFAYSEVLCGRVKVLQKISERQA